MSFVDKLVPTEVLGSAIVEAAGIAMDVAGPALVDIVGGEVSGRAQINHWSVGNDDRAAIYPRQSELESRFGGEFDATVYVDENFDSLSHEAIMAAVEPMNPAVVTASAEGWTAIGAALSMGLNDFKVAVMGEIGSGDAARWAGVAADNAKQATERYVTASDQLAAAGSLVGTKVEEAATAITQVKATMPPPVELGFLSRPQDFVLSAFGIKGPMHEASEAHQQAIHIMKTVYSPVMRQADTRVPTLPAPVSVTGGPGGDGGMGGGGASGGSGGYGGGGGTGAWSADYTEPRNTDVDTAAGAPGSEGGSSQGAGGAVAGDGANAANPNEWSGGSDDRSEVRAAGLGPDGPGTAVGSAGVGSPGSGSGNGSGSGYGSTTPGHGSGGAGSTGSGYAGTGSVSGGYGGSGVVAAPGGGQVPAASAAGAGAAGKPGAPGAGMMPPAAGRGQGDSDAEHDTPAYLVNADNGNDLVGTLPLVAPPVLGA
ncbi:hypothetical protein [Rhodococcus sp. Q]|uniref:hypothetical protein n=1 Tax=Rhodococcus sp. Q TaxID=2502252 RepID=UPI0010F54766|nr:hypothetical protein [Rhodococcus sp. Q]